MATYKYRGAVFCAVVPSLYKSVRFILDYISSDDSGSRVSGPDFYHISRLYPSLFL